jgi:DNA-binding NarL/FixJ family response regulator
MRQELTIKKSLKILVIDDHELFLNGTMELLKARYPDAKIMILQTAQNLLYQVSIFQPDLLFMDILISEKPGMMAQTAVGIQILKSLMYSHPNLNFFIQSGYIKTLVRMKAEIDAHKGGFIVADKNISNEEMLNGVNWALSRLTNKQKKYHKLQVLPEWFVLLHLAFQEGFQDKKIAQNIHVSERTVRNYWEQLQNALGIDGKELKNQGRNIRVITQIKAREVGLID